MDTIFPSENGNSDDFRNPKPGFSGGNGPALRAYKRQTDTRRIYLVKTARGGRQKSKIGIRHDRT